MKVLKTVGFLTWLFVGMALVADPVSAQVAQATQANHVVGGAGHYPYVIARPGDRQWIRNTPIELRPTRPLHVYGNRVRKGYVVGSTQRNLPVSRLQGMSLIIRRF